MRTISYILGGQPSNLNDCLDYLLHHKLSRIIMTLQTPEETTEEYSVMWLKGSFVWIFEDTTASYTTTYGGCFRHETAQRQQQSVDNANARLERELAAIKKAVADVEIEGAAERFALKI